MSTYFCYTLWDFLEPDVTEQDFENDEEAIDFWSRLADEHCPTACMSITRLVEVNGVKYEDFVALFRRGVNGLEIIKSHAL